jgi:hypothetical protein
MTKILESTENSCGFFKIILEEDSSVGFYIFVYETAASKHPERDYLQDDLAMAQTFCLEDFGVPINSWVPSKS